MYVAATRAPATLVQLHTLDCLPAPQAKQKSTVSSIADYCFPATQSVHNPSVPALPLPALIVPKVQPVLVELVPHVLPENNRSLQLKSRAPTALLKNGPMLPLPLLLLVAQIVLLAVESDHLPISHQYRLYQ